MWLKSKWFLNIVWIQFHHLHFSENSNYWREILLDVIRQNIAWWCQQTFCSQMFVDNSQQCFAFTPQANFPTHNLNFHWRWRWWDQIQATFINLFYFTWYLHRGQTWWSIFYNPVTLEWWIYLLKKFWPVVFGLKVNW